MKGDTAQRLEELYERIQKDPRYRNEKMGDTFVPGKGSLTSSMVLIGEAPGQEEEKARSPFVGPAGRNLNTLLESAGLDRSEVFITNLVKYRPFDSKGGNRKPSTRESRYALPYLLEELNILAPQSLVCLGSTPAVALLEEPHLRMGEANGVWYEKHGFRILVIYHPSPYNYLDSRKREAMQKAFASIPLPQKTDGTR